MKKLILSFIALFIGAQMFAQQDAQAKKILEKVSTTTKSYSTIKLKFLYIMDNRAEKVQDTTKGTIYIKGDMFKLFFKGNEIFSDGKTIWTHQFSANEMTISEPEEGDEDALNPTTLLTIYEKGFKYQFMGEFKNNSETFYQIDLYPENPNAKSYTMIKLKIDKANSRLTSVKMVGKDGIDYLIELTQFKPNVKVADSMFTFDPKKYPKNIEINDMRD
ncbi:MAG: outer membrane lipoprotein carrier protein LolA [Bacteroidales bacterium]|nr:outer membrane lipoprotein carrier protein LolA [Bacteroidales bacterium]